MMKDVKFSCMQKVMKLKTFSGGRYFLAQNARSSSAAGFLVVALACLVGICLVSN